jgi:hypothetical protein
MTKHIAVEVVAAKILVVRGKRVMLDLEIPDWNIKLGRATLSTTCFH